MLFTALPLHWVLACHQSPLQKQGLLVQVHSPVSNGTQVVMKRGQNVAQAVVKTRTSLSSWSRMGARRRPVGPTLDSEGDDLPGEPLLTGRTSESFATEVVAIDGATKKGDSCSSSDSSVPDNTDEDEEQIPVDRIIETSTAEGMTEGELWYELEKELQRHDDEADVRAEEEAAAAAKQITEEKVLADAVESKKSISSSDVSESHQFYHLGTIMHMVSLPLSSAESR